MSYVILILDGIYLLKYFKHLLIFFTNISICCNNNKPNYKIKNVIRVNA